jgi:uncharacterized protein (TIRG00374 family)
MISARLMRRGLELFAAISLLGFVGVLFYGRSFRRFMEAMLSLHWGWVLVGIALASADWIGGGLRLWILTRHVYSGASFRGAVLAGGLNTWASFLTPSQTGGGPIMIYTLKRWGVPIPEAMISSLMTFVATVVFFAIAGPLAVFLGAGRSLEQHGVLGEAITLYDLFNLSLAGFIAIGGVILFLIAFPELARRLAQAVVELLGSRVGTRLASRLQSLREGIDRSQECLVAFFRGRGWLYLAAAVLVTPVTFANRLAAGYVVLKMLGIHHAQFVDVILLQTLITFLLYFAPTPGGSGLAEILSAAVMSIYVPRELTPSYILLWRIVVCYLTVAAGSVIFWGWLKGARSETAGGD